MPLAVRFRSSLVQLRASCCQFSVAAVPALQWLECALVTPTRIPS